MVPLSSNAERLYPGEAIVKVEGQESKLMADQIMAADKSRLKNLLGAVSKIDMQSAEMAIRVHLGMAK